MWPAMQAEPGRNGKLRHPLPLYRHTIRINNLQEEYRRHTVGMLLDTVGWVGGYPYPLGK
jgi:hypothetical protein